MSTVIITCVNLFMDMTSCTAFENLSTSCCFFLFMPKCDSGPQLLSFELSDWSVLEAKRPGNRRSLVSNKNLRSDDGKPIFYTCKIMLIPGEVSLQLHMHTIYFFFIIFFSIAAHSNGC